MIQRRLALPLRKDDMHNSRCVSSFLNSELFARLGVCLCVLCLHPQEAEETTRQIFLAAASELLEGCDSVYLEKFKRGTAEVQTSTTSLDATFSKVASKAKAAT